MPNQRTTSPNDGINQMRDRAAWKQKASEPSDHCPAFDPEEAHGGEMIRTTSSTLSSDAQMD